MPLASRALDRAAEPALGLVELAPVLVGAGQEVAAAQLGVDRAGLDRAVDGLAQRLASRSLVVPSRNALRVVITSEAMSRRASWSARASASRPTCWASWWRQAIASTWAWAASTRARASLSSSEVSRTASSESAAGSSSVSIAVSATARAASRAPRVVGEASSGSPASCSASSLAARSGWPLELRASAASTASRARSTSASPDLPSPASSRSARSKCWAASSGPPTWAAS